MTQSNLDIINQRLQERPFLADIFEIDELCRICQQIEDRNISKPEIIGALLNGKISIDLVENGLRLIAEKASRAKKRNVYGSLRDSQSVGTVFELAVLGGLARYFGNNNVNPYPDIGCGKLMEAEVIVEGQNLYVEVTVLSFGQEEKALIKKGASSISGSMGKGRLVMKIEEKIQRYVANSPNLLVVHQGSCFPFERDAPRTIRCYLDGNEDLINKQHWAGVFFLPDYKKVVWLPNQNVVQSSSLEGSVIQQLENSLKLLPH